MVKLNAVMLDQDERVLKIINYDDHYYSHEIASDEDDYVDEEYEEVSETEESVIDEFSYIEEDVKLPSILKLPSEKKIESK